MWYSVLRNVRRNLTSCCRRYISVDTKLKKTSWCCQLERVYRTDSPRWCGPGLRASIWPMCTGSPSLPLGQSINNGNFLRGRIRRYRWVVFVKLSGSFQSRIKRKIKIFVSFYSAIPWIKDLYSVFTDTLDVVNCCPIWSLITTCFQLDYIFWWYLMIFEVICSVFQRYRFVNKDWRFIQ